MIDWKTLAVVLGIVISIVTPIVKLTSTIAKLATIVDNLQKSVSDITIKNTDSHKRIWDKEEEQDKILGEHEIRIRMTESAIGSIPIHDGNIK